MGVVIPYTLILLQRVFGSLGEIHWLTLIAIPPKSSSLLGVVAFWNGLCQQSRLSLSSTISDSSSCQLLGV